MTTSYNARVDLDRPAPAGHDDEWTDRAIDGLRGFSPAISRGLHGGATIDFTVPAADVRQAATIALSLASDVAEGADVVGLELLTTAEFDRRAGAHLPRLLSVSEVAQRLGISRQAVLQRIDSGSMPATKVGTTWVVPEGVAPTVREPVSDVRYESRAEAVLREIIEPIEATGEARRDEYDIDAIASAVLADADQGYALLVDHDEFWSVVSEHELER